VVEQLTGYPPGRDGAIFGLARRVPLPSTVTHYVTAGARWDREALPVDDAQGGAYADFFAVPTTYEAGTVSEDTWFGGVIGAFNDPRLAQQYGWQVEPYRQGDALYLMVPNLTDAAGHGGAVLYYPEYSAQLYQGSDLVLDAYDPLMLWGFPAPAARTRYRLVVDDQRANLFWQHSTRITTTWGFTTRRPAGDHVVLPLLDVRWQVPLSDTTTAPAGRDLRFAVRFSAPEGVAAAPVRSPVVEVSWDHGTTWRRVTVTGCSSTEVDSAGGHPTTCGVRLHDASTGTASLRVTGVDTAGRTVSQTVVDAYSVA
jgi:hypothetical protein